MYFEKLVGEKRYSSPAMTSMPRLAEAAGGGEAVPTAGEGENGFHDFFTRDFCRFRVVAIVPDSWE